nr:pentatricopeptide repeat-containing protein At1g79080, chloroplastic [Ipomoea batatas]
MTMLINSSPPLTNPSSDLARKPCEFLPERPKLYDSFLHKKRFCRVLAIAHTRTSNSCWKQSELAVKDGIFVLPNWNVASNDRTARELKLHDAILYLEYMVEKGYKPDLTQATNLVYALCQHDKAGKATRVMLTIVRSGSTPMASCCAFLVKYLCKVGSVRRAIYLVEKMEEYGKLPSIRIYPNVASYNVLLRSLGLEGRWEEANRLLADMDREGILPTTATYNILIDSLASHGRIRSAIDILEEMHSGVTLRATADSYNPIITHLCKEKKVPDVINYLNQMIDQQCDPNPGTYNAIAVLCEEGMVHEAFKILERLRAIKGHPINDFYRNVISILCRMGNTYPAFQLLCDITASGFTPDKFTYSYLIKGLCRERMQNAAIEIVRILEANCYRPNAKNFGALVIGLCKGGRTDLALSVYEEMIEKGYMPDEKTYSIIVEGLVYEEEKELASLVLKELHMQKVISTDMMQWLALQYELEEGLSV